MNYLTRINAGYIDSLFLQYQEDPNSVDSSWRYFFEGLTEGLTSPSEGPALIPKVSSPNGQNNSQKNSQNQNAKAIPADPGLRFSSEAKVAELITAYRSLGRIIAHLDPLSEAPSSHPLLELSQFELDSQDLDKVFTAGHLIGLGPAKLKDILTRLSEIYCGAVGIEYTHIQNPEERNWIQNRIENSKHAQSLDPLDFETRKFILKRLTESETFERFLHTRYVAQKRFSLEGAESLIPLLDCMIEKGSELGAQEFVLGMAHRGRLNVLANCFQKKLESIFTEFEGSYKIDLSRGEGDVKYHMGFSTDFTTRKGKDVHLSLASNPSHLEFVNPVIQGVARAKQRDKKDYQGKTVLPIAIHGDAAFAGQGVCYETLNLSQLTGYQTGGTLHIIINNQVGFTTNPKDSRSTTYATDLAKMLEVPIFHVNADRPEALWSIAQLCMEYRQTFHKDIFIDLICYRKHGHNEGDEPAFTQPVLYKKIKTHPSARDLYAEFLAKQGIVGLEESQEWVQKEIKKLTEAQIRTKAEEPQPFVSVFEAKWKGLKRPEEKDFLMPVKTSVSESILKNLAKKLNQIPHGFHLHPKLLRFYEARQKTIEEGKDINWGSAEALAFATLLNEGHCVRLSGQDVERGTFTHRHCVLYDFETGDPYTPLNHLREGQGCYDVHNSHLSETAVLGFEYGFSSVNPNTLVIWEAQFGDFSNGAQVVIDQFITSSESKWQRMNGLTLLLPHSFEGQGPEHSSARLERFLQLCGKNNIIIANLTTPAQLFHALRRQIKRDFRKPLVIMSPKSLLRHPLAVSELKEFSEGIFQEAIDDPLWTSEADRDGVTKVLLCSGKIYTDLRVAQQKAASTKSKIALVRVEQLYPWPGEKLAEILRTYKKAKIFWVQEEPKNMGAWGFVFNTWHGGLDFFQEKVGRAIQYIGRETGAAPAVGSHKLHEQEQEAIMQKALL